MGQYELLRQPAMLRFGREKQFHTVLALRTVPGPQLYTWPSPAPQESHQPGGTKGKTGLQPWASCHTQERLLASYATALLIQHACLRNL